MQWVGLRWVLTALLIGAFTTARADGLSDCAPMLQATGPALYRGTAPEHVALCRLGYVMSYNLETRVPDWVLEDITPARLDGTADRKLEDFHPDNDPALPEDHRVRKEDYNNTHFDRGHMAPAGDMKWDQTAMAESFLMTNMAPQVGIGMNRNIWAHLEDAVRGWAQERGHVVVITGPVYGDKPRPIVQNEGKPNRVEGKVLVPESFYKIVYDPARRRAIAFLVPNQNLTGRRVDEFIATIKDIEDRTGLNFLSKLPARDQRQIESTRSPMWRQAR